MKSSSYGLPLILLLVVILLTCFYFIGYVTTLFCSIALSGFFIMFILFRGDIKKVLSKRVNLYSIFALLVILIFFTTFSLLFLKKTELIFFDENIYQSDALGIIHTGSGLICWYGTAQVKQCFMSELGFDPAGWPFIIAIAFELFGASVSTAYNLELFIGVLSIVAVFLVSSMLIRRKEVGVISTAIFALIPMLFIWAKTEANPSLPFMAFATLTIFFFLLFVERINRRTLALFTFSLILTIYMRIEAILLLPIFFICFLTLSDKSLKETFVERAKLLVKTWQKIESKSHLIILSIVFLALIEPELYTLVATTAELHANAVFYLGPKVVNFSFSNFLQNIGINLSYLAGQITIYPIIFLVNITVFAVLGVAFLLFSKKYPNRIAVLLLPLLIVLGYFTFYNFYWAGSVLVGTGVRFMLILCPPLSILAAFGLIGVSDFLIGIVKKGGNKKIAEYVVYSVLIVIFFIIPFYYTVPFLTHPNYNYEGYPTVNVTPNNPYQMIYPNRSLSFIYKNYNLVPTNCLVFSELPYVWYQLNRSSAIPEVATESYPNLKQYGCYVFDYDWWCTIKPYNTTVCNPFISHYKVKVLATESSGIGDTNYTLYQILNYTPP